MEEQELETALPQPPMASGVQFLFQLIIPYGRCPREHVLESLNELDAKDQNSWKGHIQYRCPLWDILENTGDVAKAKVGSGSQAAHSEGASTAFWGSSGCLGQVKPLRFGVC